MAPTLTSNSFLLNTTPHSRLTFQKKRLTIFAKQAGPFPSLRFGKNNRPSSSEEPQAQPDDSANTNPLRFNFGKIPDVKSLIPAVNNPSTALSFGNQRRKDPGTVFVAGATGQAGIRIAQMLLREGFIVRAGVPELGSAQELARLAAQYKIRLYCILLIFLATIASPPQIISNEESRRINAVQSTFQDTESIAKAIGNASKVVVTIGPAENGPTSEVSTSDALQVIQAAQLAGVSHVAIIYDGSIGSSSTYNVLDGISSFFNNLLSRSQPLTVPEFLQKVIETDVSYTFIKTSLTEDFSPEKSYNVVVSAERSASVNDYKVVEVFTDPSAPSRRVDELFRITCKSQSRGRGKVAAEKAREAAEATKKLEEEVKKLSKQEARAASLAEEAQEKADAAGTSMENLLSKAKDFGSGLSWNSFSSQLTIPGQNPEEKPKVQIATVRGQARARSLPAQKAVVKPPSLNFPSFKPKEKPEAKPKPKDKQTEEKKEVRKQETCTGLRIAYSTTLSTAWPHIIRPFVSRGPEGTQQARDDFSRVSIAIPEDGRRKAYAESLAKVRAEEEARVAAEKAREAAEATKKLEEEVKKLSKQEARAASLAEEAQEKADAAGTSMENLLSKAKDFGSGLSWNSFSSQLTIPGQNPEEKPKVQIATVRGQARARSLPAQKAVVKPPSLNFPSFKPKEKPEAKPKPKDKQTEEKKEVRKVFGGLFSQETVYIDDD
ncbi:protein plastid transcriptionally active 16 [Quercus suber]|uniref:Protein plastid transcriptionally active 16 n=1 Tax=Quercus suber TaxID=58331 RepID=A0AAW0J3G0_QUESU